MQKSIWGLIGMSVGLVTACNALSSLSEKKSESQAEATALKAEVAKVEAPAKAGGSAAAAPTSTAVPANSAVPANAAITPSAAPSDMAPPVLPEVELPPGRSKIPTPEEWAANPKEVTVKGSSALKCETKVIREYLRVRCSDTNDTGGTPTAIKVVKGETLGALTMADEGVTTLIVPFVNDTDFAAIFSWTDKSHRLAVRWPNGVPKPTVHGIFEGAASPIDAYFDKATKTRLCECVREVTGSSNCADSYTTPNVDCFRTYENNCVKLFECSRGEPASPPRCQYGYTNGGVTNWCFRVCSPQDPCPSGQKCIAKQPKSYCM